MLNRTKNLSESILGSKFLPGQGNPFLLASTKASHSPLVKKKKTIIIHRCIEIESLKLEAKLTWT